MDFAHNANMPSIMEDALRRVLIFKIPNFQNAKSIKTSLVDNSKPNALPHAQVTNRKFKTGDLIVVDLTLRYKGYVSDATRTFAVGKISAKAQKAYDIVYESQRLGLKAAKPGVLCSSVDDACRKYIIKEGFGKQFIHSTGHGIGLDVHEAPAVSANSGTKLGKNMGNYGGTRDIRAWKIWNTHRRFTHSGSNISCNAQIYKKTSYSLGIFCRYNNNLPGKFYHALVCIWKNVFFDLLS